MRRRRRRRKRRRTRHVRVALSALRKYLRKGTCGGRDFFAGEKAKERNEGRKEGNDGRKDGREKEGRVIVSDRWRDCSC